MLTLQAWICDIDEASFSDSSRPDRCNGTVGYQNCLNACS
jgi:hypothetical protein